MAETLNISQAAKVLRVSRVTLQNRLKALEEHCGYTLLELDENNRYKLTPRAEMWVQELRIWLRQGEDIFSLSDERAQGLLQSSPRYGGETFFCQQHPLSAVWEHNTPYLQAALNTWIDSRGQFDSPEFSDIRRNAILARLHEDRFVIMEIGKDAAMVQWLGLKWCMSAIGKPLSSTPMSSKADQIITYTYRQTILQGAPWYDHISAELPRPEQGKIERAYYRRLILPCKLPDGSPLVASVVELSEELVIGDLEILHDHQQTSGT